MMRPQVLSLLLAFTAVPFAVHANEAAPTECDVVALSRDTGSGTLSIHAGPESAQPEIAVVPTSYEAAGHRFATELRITGSHKGWLRIVSATTNDYITDDPSETVFEGTGWIPGSQVHLVVEGSVLRAFPQDDAPVATDFTHQRPGDYGPDFFRVDAVHACVGHWVEVEGTYFLDRVRGWSSDTCANQVTTCP